MWFGLFVRGSVTWALMVGAVLHSKGRPGLLRSLTGQVEPTSKSTLPLPQHEHGGGKGRGQAENEEDHQDDDHHQQQQQMTKSEHGDCDPHCRKHQYELKLNLLQSDQLNNLHQDHQDHHRRRRHCHHYCCCSTKILRECGLSFLRATMLVSTSVLLAYSYSSLMSFGNAFCVFFAATTLGSCIGAVLFLKEKCNAHIAVGQSLSQSVTSKQVKQQTIQFKQTNSQTTQHNSTQTNKRPTQTKKEGRR